MHKLRERMVFYDRMATFFDELSRKPDQSYAAAARAAAKRYGERRNPLGARLAIYDGPSLLSRLHAFSVMNRTHAVEMKSRAKDLVLGVAGLHTIL
jgi:hypothetical protein